MIYMKRNKRIQTRTLLKTLSLTDLDVVVGGKKGKKDC